MPFADISADVWIIWQHIKTGELCNISNVMVDRICLSLTFSEWIWTSYKRHYMAYCLMFHFMLMRTILITCI